MKKLILFGFVIGLVLSSGGFELPSMETVTELTVDQIGGRAELDQQIADCEVEVILGPELEHCPRPKPEEDIAWTSTEIGF